MRIVFFGTPDFAIPSLESILNSKHELLSVVTNPDKKSGRGLKTKPSPISTFCSSKLIECLHYSDFENQDVYNALENMNPDLFVVVAFKILPEKIINIPKHGSINVHPSLLPRYRGSSPIQHAILNGDRETGVTVFKLNAKVDSGHVINQNKYIIKDQINFSELYIELSKFGAKTLMEAIGLIESGKVNYVAQNNSNHQTTYAKKINIQDCRIDWNMSALDINNKIRAFSKKPGAFTVLNNKKIKILDSNIYKSQHLDIKVSDCMSFQKSLFVGTKDYPIKINSLQVEGKKEISGRDFANSNFFAKNKVIRFD